jgi:copper transport protein
MIVRFAFRARSILLVLTALAVLLTPALVFAHARLVRSTPAANSRDEVSPTSLSLWFSERPELRFTRLRLLDSSGTEIRLGAVANVVGDRMGVTATIDQQLTPGKYTVAWTTAAADGHPIKGRYSFTVTGSTAASKPIVDTARPLVRPDTASQRVANSPVEAAADANFSTAARWAELVALLVLIGTVVFRLFVLPDAGLSAPVMSDAIDRARRLAQAVLVLFVITTIWRLSAQSDLAMVGGTGRLGAMLTVAGDTAWGRGWAIGAIGAAVAAAGILLARAGRTGWIIAALGVVGICFGEGLTGHAAVLSNRASLATAIDLAHLLGAGGWLGGLASVVLCGLSATSALEPRDATRSGQGLVRAYHKAAIECVALVLVTALLGAWVRLSAPSQLLSTTYGRILLVKFSLSIVLLAFGWFHWRTVVTPDWTDDTRFRFRRSAAGELLVGALVLAATAVLVSTALPSS